MMKTIPVAACLLILCGGSATLAQAQKHSALWGPDGGRWTPQSRLPDFSFAGYRCGEQPLPDVPPGVSVRDFGARGDGQADDTRAFLDAIASVRGGAIEIPPGRYKITGILEITKPNVVLRGAGPDHTVLYFPTPLQAVRPNMGATTGGRPTSNYSWSGGHDRRPPDLQLLLVRRFRVGSRQLRLAAAGRDHRTGSPRRYRSARLRARQTEGRSAGRGLPDRYARQHAGPPPVLG